MKYIIAVIVVFMLVDIGQAEMHKAIDLRTPTTASQKLEIDGLSGSNITFTSWSKNEIYINLHVSIESSSDDYERDYIQNVKLSQMSENGVLRIRLEEPAISNGSGSSILNIFKHFYVRKDISGEIFVPQSNPFSTDMRYGSLTLENMKGDLQLLGTSNTLKLKNCSSISQIDNNYGKTWISG